MHRLTKKMQENLEITKIIFGTLFRRAVKFYHPTDIPRSREQRFNRFFTPFLAHRKYFHYFRRKFIT